jgi:3-Oxoacyl-[acyl-carrier-protein (ACP)] synthase III C terminal
VHEHEHEHPDHPLHCHLDLRAARYLPDSRVLQQHRGLGELAVLPDPDGVRASLLESIDLIVPHQANKSMVIDLALKAGLTEDGLYFNVETVGNASSASITLAIHDAVRDGVIKEPTRIFARASGRVPWPGTA